MQKKWESVPIAPTPISYPNFVSDPIPMGVPVQRCSQNSDAKIPPDNKPRSVGLFQAVFIVKSN